MLKMLPITRILHTAEDTRAFGEWLATPAAPGDLVILTGDLGAGKTTLTQGIGEGLGVRGDVTSPTFVISRVHPSLVDGPPLVHVDAYRLGGAAELDDLDLDTDVDDAVTVVEWGEGLAEALSSDRLELSLSRPPTTSAPSPSPRSARAGASSTSGHWRRPDQRLRLNRRSGWVPCRRSTSADPEHAVA